MLLLDILDEVDDFLPGNGLGSIGIEDLENILPGWGTLLGSDLSEHLSGFLSEGTGGFHGGLEFFLVDLTGFVGVDHLEDLVGLLEVLLGELVVVLLGDLLEEVAEFIPGNGTGFIGIEFIEDFLPGWWSWFLGADLSEHLSGLLSTGTGGFHSSLEFFLVDLTGFVGVDHLEDLVGLLEVLLGEFVIVLLGDLLEEVAEFIPGNGLGSIGIEFIKDFFPGWWLWLARFVQRADLDSGGSGQKGGNSNEFHRVVYLSLCNLNYS